MTPRLRLITWTAPLVAAALLAAAFAAWTLKQRVDGDPERLIGGAIPEVVLPMLTGEGAQAAAGPGRLDLKTAGVGRPMLVNLFASWCTPCQVEHPHLMTLKAEGAAVVGVAVWDAPADTRAFLDRHGDPYSMVLVDRDGETPRALGLGRGLPMTLAVDARGKVVAVHQGALTDADQARALIAAAQAPFLPLPTATRRAAP